jgi:FkbM family methyltransferase
VDGLHQRAARIDRAPGASVMIDARSRWSRLIREKVLSHYLVPDSRFGLPAGLVPHLPRQVPVSLVDVGANRGEFAASVRAHCGLNGALLIEPQPDLAALLSKEFQDAKVANAAVSNAPGRARFNVLEADSCSSLLPILPDAGFSGRQIDTRVKAQYDVDVFTLDQVLAQSGWSNTIDVLKIDTQGNELQVIEGAVHTMPLVRLLWIEVSFRKLYEGDALFSTVHERLSALGFRLYSLHEVFRDANRELLQADALFLGPKAA